MSPKSKTTRKDLENIPMPQRKHKWRLCPLGEHWVRTHLRKVSVSKKNPAGLTEVEGHCRHNRSKKDEIYKDEINEISRTRFNSLKGSPFPCDLGFNKTKAYNGNSYDSLIRGWTKYWNEVLKPKIPLDPNLVKALIASESSFNPNSNKLASKGNKARGLMQVTDQTIKMLKNEKGELKDHLIDLDQKDMYAPSPNISAGIRWLFRKKETASARLKREATWEEAVAEYKSYLDKMLRNPQKKFKNLEAFETFYERLKNKCL
ncbi:MAG TPA: transglycosylase SLT domain-containing protein [Bdellovibrionota bacterium]|nr:transglycosylase SLT domain-containing protein [Bdellovibrionota bacterium]